MNCQSFEEILSELARDRTSAQPMEANGRRSALVHLDECTECTLRLQDGRALTHRLDEMAREMESVTAPARVEEELRNKFSLAFSRPLSSPSGPIDQPIDQIGRWNRWVVAAAAILLIVLGVAGLRLRVGRQSQLVSGRSETPGEQDSPKELPSTVAAGLIILPSKANRELTVSVRRRNPYRRTTGSFNRDSNRAQPATTETTTAIANDTESEVATHFMPLGYAGPINLQDGGQLVRVELSRSAMVSLGLPVNMDRYSERVKADVLLGADGLARAIRFVQ